jgi:hypothetical protein
LTLATTAHWPAPEDIQHIYLSPVRPAFKWMRRKIEGIEPILTKANHFSVFTLHFKILDSEEKMFCHLVIMA